MSQNKNIFNNVETKSPQRSRFDLSQTHVTSCNFGEMIPVYVQPTLPGSVWDLSAEWIIKAAPTLAPIMHKNVVYAHTWYVPYRILWPNWTDFITETKTEGVLPAVPYLTFNGSQNTPTNPGFITRLAQYLGLPSQQAFEIGQVGNFNYDFQAFWFAAYQLIWSEHYRDQNLQEKLDFELVDGDNNSRFSEFTKLRLRAWMHDYFTSALPETQKGDTVNIPMVFDDVPVKTSSFVPDAITTLDAVAPDQDIVVSRGTAGGAASDLWIEGAALTAEASIIDLRTAEQLQKFRETMMTAGSRYNEFLEAIYGVKIPDETVQRPVYLGGARADLIVQETLNTAGNDAMDLPQGNQSGNLRAYNLADYGKKYVCPEHGVIMTILTVMPNSMYFQGVNKEFTKLSDPFEFGTPLMANIGEQPITKNEIYAWQDPAISSGTFGYQSRYAEYKQTPDRISGDMTTSLLFWNEARKFATLPVLNSDFIEMNHANDQVDRIFAVQAEDIQKLWVMFRQTADVLQPLPYFGTPKLGD